MLEHSFSDSEVEAAFAAFPDAQLRHLLRIREIIIEVGESLDSLGQLKETLKWGQPSFLPTRPRVGSTVRVGSFDKRQVALYFNCQTMLVENFRSIFGTALCYSKNRAVLFDVSKPLPENIIKECVRMALQYHLDKKRQR